MIIRAQEPGDAAAVRGVLADAFGDPDRVPDLAEALLAGPSRLALVAEVDGAVVGHVQLSRCWVDAPARILEVLVLSPLGVAPARHGQGIGGALVRAALDWARDRTPLVFLEGDPRYYSRFGFVRASTLGFTPPSVRIPDAAFQVVAMPSHDPSMSGALVYCDAFWRFDSVGLRR